MRAELTQLETKWWSDFTGAELANLLKERKAANKQAYSHIKITGAKKTVLRRLMHFFPSALTEALDERETSKGKEKESEEAPNPGKRQKTQLD